MKQYRSERKELRHMTGSALLSALYFLVCLLIGYGVAVMLEEQTGGALRTLPFVICLIVAFFLQNALHSLGHLLFGKLLGMRVIALSLFRQVHVKEKEHFRTRQYLPESLLCSCLMAPPPDSEGVYTLFWLGGAIFNLLIGLLALLLLMVCRLSLASLGGCLAFCFFITGIGLFCFRALPLERSHVPNDAMKAWRLYQDTRSRVCWSLLTGMLSVLSEEETPIEKVPVAYLRQPEAADTVFSTALLLRQYDWFLWLNRWDEAEQCLQKLVTAKENCPEEWRQRIEQECIFFLGTQGLAENLPAGFLTKEKAQRYETQATPESLRCLYAWSLTGISGVRQSKQYHDAAVKSANQIAFRPAAQGYKRVIARCGEIRNNQMRSKEESKWEF